MKSSHHSTAAACVLALALAPAAEADFANGPNPYAGGFGFDAPDESGASTWGGWARGDAGTLYAEWDHFSGAPNPAAPDVGVAGTPAAMLAWNPGTFAAGTGNLYNFSAAQTFTITLDGSLGPGSGPISVALQTETWGTPLEFTSAGTPLPPVTLNGVQWDSKTITYQQSDFPSTLGPVLFEHVLFTWTLEAPAAFYEFVLQGGPHTSFAQAAVDIGPAPVPVPGAVWLLGSAGLALFGRGRRGVTTA